MNQQTKTKAPTRKSLEQLVDDQLNIERVQVQAQPHRRGDRGDMTDAFGTFLRANFGPLEQDCMHRCWEAGQKYILRTSDLRRVDCIPAKVFLRDETPSCGGEIAEETIEEWRQQIDRCKTAMKCSGLPGFRAAENLILEDVPPEFRLYGPVKRAVINLAICLGFYGGNENKMLTCKELRTLLSYSEETGQFKWNISTRNKAIGEIAGVNSKDSYIRISIKGRCYLAHRLAWLYMLGEFPTEQIDHANMDRSDNRWVNLRWATQVLNGINKRRSPTNTSGFKGVTWDRVTCKWRARIKIGICARSLGSFISRTDAHAAYVIAAKRVYGEYARPE